MKNLRKRFKKIFLILLLISNLNLYSKEELVNLNEFLALKNQYIYIDKYLSNAINDCNFPDAAFCFYKYDGGSYRGKIFADNTSFPIVSFIEEINKNKFIQNNIVNTLQSINKIFQTPLLSNQFYYNDEFGEGIYHPFLELYYQFNDSLILRAVIFFEQKRDLFDIKSDYNTSFDILNIYKETKFDLHLVIYHKDLLENRLIYLKKEYSKRKKYNDYKDQIKKIKEFLKFLNSK